MSRTEKKQLNYSHAPPSDDRRSVRLRAALKIHFLQTFDIHDSISKVSRYEMGIGLVCGAIRLGDHSMDQNF